VNEEDSERGEDGRCRRKWVREPLLGTSIGLFWHYYRPLLTERESERQTETETETDRDRKTETETETETETNTEAGAETETERERERGGFIQANAVN
jgi:Sec-independent protein translocase protein TatA